MSAALQKIEKSKRHWDVKKAGNRLLWRFNSGKPFTPNESDIDALHSVLDWINRNESANVNGNQLFAKLYIYYLTDHLRKYESTVFNSDLTKELNRRLATPVEMFYKAFVKDLHLNQLQKLLESSVGNDPAEIVAQSKVFKETYSEDYVVSKLNEMISEAINRLR